MFAIFKKQRKSLLEKVQGKAGTTGYGEVKSLELLKRILIVVEESHDAGKAGFLRLQPDLIYVKKHTDEVNISHCFQQIQYYTFEKRFYVLT